MLKSQRSRRARRMKLDPIKPRPPVTNQRIWTSSVGTGGPACGPKREPCCAMGMRRWF